MTSERGWQWNLGSKFERDYLGQNEIKIQHFIIGRYELKNHIFNNSLGAFSLF